MAFSSYYLWFLITRFNFTITDVESITTFTKTDSFRGFAEDCMKKRQEALEVSNNGLALYYKMNMNSSYGYDAMNTERFNTTMITTKARAKGYINNDRYRDVTKLGEDVYQVTHESLSYRCDTCIHEAFFTLDNAKTWYLIFIYDFMYKCLDMDRIHFVEGDTDSIYLAIAGDPNLSRDQGFQAVIKDHEFYNEHIFDWAPYDFYCTDESKRPLFSTKAEQIAHEKKLMGLAVEKVFDNMIALAAKAYTGWLDEEDGSITAKAIKCKGVNTRQNRLRPHQYQDVLTSGKPITGCNTSLRAIKGHMLRQELTKNALSAVHTKGQVQENGCVHPFVHPTAHSSAGVTG